MLAESLQAGRQKTKAQTGFSRSGGNRFVCLIPSCMSIDLCHGIITAHMAGTQCAARYWYLASAVCLSDAPLWPTPRAGRASPSAALLVVYGSRPTASTSASLMNLLFSVPKVNTHAAWYKLNFMRTIAQQALQIQISRKYGPGGTAQGNCQGHLYPASPPARPTNRRLPPYQSEKCPWQALNLRHQKDGQRDPASQRR